MDKLYYYTGAIFWLTVAAVIVWVLVRLTWEFIGSLFFMLKVSKRIKNFKLNDGLPQPVPTYKDRLLFVWDRTVDSAPHVDFYKSIGRVWRPWPWLSTKARKQLEDETGKDYYPG